MKEFPPLYGGALALDFVNTIDPRFGERAHDHLKDGNALARWAAFARGDRNLRVGRGDLERTLGLRFALDRVFREIARGREPAQRDLRSLRSTYAELVGDARIRREGPGWRLRGRSGADGFLLGVCESALELLAEPTHIRECAGDECGWLFRDTSRSGNRRWCSMNSCGARQKMRRYRARARRE